MVFLSISDVINLFIYLFNFIFNIDAEKPFLGMLNKVYICMFVCKDAPEYRLRRGHQQREANYKGSKKEEEVTRVLSGFSLMQSSFDTSLSL